MMTHYVPSLLVIKQAYTTLVALFIGNVWRLHFLLPTLMLQFWNLQLVFATLVTERGGLCLVYGNYNNRGMEDGRT